MTASLKRERLKLMAERLEHFGTPCYLPEPNIVGHCNACGGDIYDYELTTCECGTEVHTGCMVECGHCERKACKKCMLYDDEVGEWFCDTSGPDECRLPKPERLLVSECREEYLQCQQ